MSRRVLITSAAVIVALVLVIGYIGLTYNSSIQPTQKSAQEARNSVITYLATNYPETENITRNLVWTGGLQDNSSNDLEMYVYTTNEWNMQLNCSETSNPLYIVDANYTKGDITIDWMGLCQNGTVAEFGYVIYSIDFDTPIQKQVSQDAFEFVVDNHPEITQYSNLVYVWEGGRVASPAGFVGSETYRYVGLTWNATQIWPVGWTITEQYPVVPNPIHSVNVTYTSLDLGNVIVDWQGTWQNGAVTETNYAYTPLTL